MAVESIPADVKFCRNRISFLRSVKLFSPNCEKKAIASEVSLGCWPANNRGMGSRARDLPGVNTPDRPKCRSDGAGVSTSFCSTSSGMTPYSLRRLTRSISSKTDKTSLCFTVWPDESSVSSCGGLATSRTSSVAVPMRASPLKGRGLHFLGLTPVGSLDGVPRSDAERL